jgi:four helix bundle protein
MWFRDGRRKTRDGRAGAEDRKAKEMGYKFQELEVYKLALNYVDKIYGLSRELPISERFNLQTQLERAATSIVLNIAEGSTGQSNAEQGRFLGLALRSYLETVACFDIIERRGYSASDALTQIMVIGHELFIKLQAFRKSLGGRQDTEDRRRRALDSGHQSSISGHPSPDKGNS